MRRRGGGGGGRVDGCDAVFAGGRAEHSVGGHYEKAKAPWVEKVLVAKGGRLTACL
jgi:hypothetical protein